MRPFDSDLRELYVRTAGDDVRKGDKVDGRRVLGIALPVRLEPYRAAWERLVLEGDEQADEPPERLVPAPDEPAIERTGPSPVSAPPADRLRLADPRLHRVFAMELYRRGLDGSALRALLSGLTSMNAHVWLVGGAVRDFVVDGEQAKIKDLDLAGTASPGRLVDQLSRNGVVRRLRRVRCGSFRWRVSRQMVWSIDMERKKTRLAEYKPLAATGLPFRVWGGDMAEDAATRDLTVNTLAYDPDLGILIDPLGRGLDDLEADKKVLVPPGPGVSPRAQAEIIFRYLKLAFKWRDRDIDDTEMVRWVAELPPDLPERLSWDALRSVRAARRRWIKPEFQGEPELALAEALGTTAARVVRLVQEDER
jgi:hypothetical protein